jgi:hypothetical protein
MQMIVRASAERDALRARTREYLAKRDGTDPTDQAVETFIDDQIRALETGQVVVRAPHDVDAGAALLSINELATIIYDMAWGGLRTANGVLVLGDHPVVIHNPRAGPDQPSAWLSSPDVEVVFPLAPNFCLALGHGESRTYGEARIGVTKAEEINLRSIAHSWRFYYGPTQQCVQAARQLAKRSPTRLAPLKPVPGGLVVGHRIEGAAAPHKVDVHRAPAQIKVSRPRQK